MLRWADEWKRVISKMGKRGYQLEERDQLSARSCAYYAVMTWTQVSEKALSVRATSGYVGFWVQSKSAGINHSYVIVDPPKGLTSKRVRH